MQIFLFSYLNAFSDGKDRLHPGFSVDGTVCILTHSKPWKRDYIKIPSAVVRSNHFKARSDFVYLAIADPERVRYNNLAGGCISLDALLLTKISNFLQKPLQKFIQITVQHMTQVKISWPTLAIALKYLPSTQKDCFPEGVEVTDEMLIPSDQGEFVTMEQLYGALEGKSEEELQPYVDAYPNQMDALATAVLAGTLEQVYPAITTELASTLLPHREEIFENVEALLHGSDDEKITAAEKLEALLGTTVEIPAEVKEQPAEPADSPAQPEEAPAEPTVDTEPGTDVQTELVPAPTASDVTTANAVTAHQVGELADGFANTLESVAANFRAMGTMLKQTAQQ